jgi:hypothetical protein
MTRTDGSAWAALVCSYSSAMVVVESGLRRAGSSMVIVARSARVSYLTMG